MYVMKALNAIHRSVTPEEGNLLSASRKLTDQTIHRCPSQPEINRCTPGEGNLLLLGRKLTDQTIHRVINRRKTKKIADECQSSADECKQLTKNATRQVS